MRRKQLPLLVLGLGLGLGLGLAMAGFSVRHPGLSPHAATLELDRVAFILSWIPYGKYLGFVAALEKGFYRDEKVDVTLLRGYGGPDAVRKLVSGEATFISAPLEDVLLARAKGKKIKVIGVWQQKTDRVVYVLRGKQLETPTQLDGTTIGISANPLDKKLFTSFAQENSVDLSTVRWVSKSASAATQALLDGHVEAILGDYMDQPALEHGAKKLGQVLTVFPLGDYGINLYADAIAVDEVLLKSSPDLVRRFLTASVRGITFAAQEPKEAARLFLLKYPGFSERTIIKHWNIATAHLSQTEAGQAEFRVGFVSPEGMKVSWETVLWAHDVRTTESFDTAYTNDYLPVRH